MTISDSNPIQFWVNGEETFNESNPICGLTDACFCQPFNCDDPIIDQFTDDPGLFYSLVILDVNGVELAVIDYDEVSSGVYQLAFTPSSLSPPICEKIRLERSNIGLDDSWESQVGAGSFLVRDITFGNGLFVAVTISGGTTHVLTSPDGESWTLQTTPDAEWTSVVFGNGLFVACAQNTDDRIMTSTDGITWTLVTVDLYAWQAIEYGNGIFVAIGEDRAITSPDGVVWTLETTAANLGWNDIAYGGGFFVAVASSGSDRVMRSSDGATWTLHSSADDTVSWESLTFGNGLFVAVAPRNFASNNLIMTSID